VWRTRPVLQDPGGHSLNDLVLEIALEDGSVLGDDGVGALLNLRSDVPGQRIAHILNAGAIQAPIQCESEIIIFIITPQSKCLSTSTGLMLTWEAGNPLTPISPEMPSAHR
jgi:hypothetical protein